MRKYIFLSCGGFAGAILRYAIEQIQIQGYQGSIPLNTLLINISGTFLMSFLLTVTSEVWDIQEDIRLGLTTGFIGAYTTFSTFCKETVGLIRGGDYFPAISYVTVSAVLGLGAAYFGFILARGIGSLKESGKVGSTASNTVGEDIVETEELIDKESDVTE